MIEVALRRGSGCMECGVEVSSCYLTCYDEMRGLVIRSESD